MTVLGVIVSYPSRTHSHESGYQIVIENGNTTLAIISAVSRKLLHEVTPLFARNSSIMRMPTTIDKNDPLTSIKRRLIFIINHSGYLN